MVSHGAEIVRSRLSDAIGNAKDSGLGRLSRTECLAWYAQFLANISAKFEPRRGTCRRLPTRDDAPQRDGQSLMSARVYSAVLSLLGLSLLSTIEQSLLPTRVFDLFKNADLGRSLRQPNRI
jgi:hypothetical protein